MSASAARRLTILLAFAIPFGLYLATLAPTVTFEDSGELIAAAYILGVPHSPGYPLFTMTGKLFTLLPVGNVAYRVNLMSALFGAFAAALLAWAAVLFIEDICGRRLPQFVVHACALSSGLWIATSLEMWEQSIITEVYSLNALFVSLVLLLLAQWKRRSDAAGRRRHVIAIAFVLGLTLTNHVTSLVLLPAVFLYLLLEDRRALLRVRTLGPAGAAFLLGLAPYVYLPLASAFDPILDWGDPETLSGLRRAMFIGFLQVGEGQTLAQFGDRLAAFGAQVLEQWAPVFLPLALAGGLAALIGRRNPGLLFLALLFLCGPFVVWNANVDVTSLPPGVIEENAAQLSVLYIPFYQVLALLMGIGAASICRLISSRAPWPWVVPIGFALLPLVPAWGTGARVDKSDYRFAEDYAANVFAFAPEGAVVLANWDPFYFPLVHAQLVEGRRPDLVVLDQPLLRRSWYLQMLERQHPEFTALVRPEIDAFGEAVRPFEAGDDYDGAEIRRAYEALINAMIDRSRAGGREVYFTYDRPPGIASRYDVEPVIVARRLTADRDEVTSVPDERLRLDGLTGRPAALDRRAGMMREHYGRGFRERGVLLDRLDDRGPALRLYRRAAELLDEDHRLRPGVDAAIRRLERP